jgi:hypothetical protein
MLTPVRFGDFNLNHIRPGQVLARFIDQNTVVEAMRIVNKPVGIWNTGSKKLKISVPVDEYVFDTKDWRYTRVARQVGHVFNFNYCEPSTNPFRTHLDHRPEKKSVKRRWQAKHQNIERACWVSNKDSSDWYPLSRQAAKKLGIGREFFQVEDKLTPDKVFKGVLCDADVELLGSGPLNIKAPKPTPAEPRICSVIEPSRVNSNPKQNRLKGNDGPEYPFRF